MEPSIPTSFIPKRPISSEVESKSYSNKTVSIFSILSFVIVLGTGIAFGGVYLYGKQLESQKVKLEQSIIDAKDGIGTEFVSDMKRLDARIDGVKELIKNHIVVTPIFEALQNSTLRSIQYKDFNYSIKVDPSSKSQVVGVELTGIARNYSTIALQSDAFSSNTLIKNPVFSNLTIDDKTRNVNFKLSFSVNITDLSYQTFIDSVIKNQDKQNNESTT